MPQPTRFKNPQAEDSQFQLRLIVAYALIVLMFLVLLSRFIWLQVLQHEHFSTLAQNNRISLVPILPNRGLILDRNGVVLAQNYSAYTLELTPSKIADLAATEAELRKLVDITPRDERQFKRLLTESKNFESIPLKTKLSEEEAARVAAQAWRFPGVEVKARLFRDYPFKEMTSHVLGYIGRINQRDKERLEEEENRQLQGLQLYRQDRPGSGVRGRSARQGRFRGSGDRFRRPRGALAAAHAAGQRQHLEAGAGHPPAGNGGQAVRRPPRRAGGDRAVHRRRARLPVKPGFDPNLFIDGIDTQTWSNLNNDWQKPMINRALRGTYPPGSTFKPFMAMAALENHAIGMRDIRPAPGYFTLPGSSHQFRDSKKAGNGMINLQRAIEVSSDTFFYKLAWDMGIDKIHPALAQFGLGSKSGIDLDGESIGVLPSKEWKAKRFARYKEEFRRWYPADVVSIGIGQGFNAYTPLQMANATAIMANDGQVFKPHLVQQVVDTRSGKARIIEPMPTRQIPFKPENFEYVKRGMEGVMTRGTGARLGVGLQYSMAGKTGTAQVVQIKQGAKYNAAALAEQYRDHSWFIAFAPVDKPRIAVAVIVENAGFGAAAAAPIVRALFDYYLLGKVPKDIEGTLKTMPTDTANDNADLSN